MLRFTIRALLIVVTIVACILAFLRAGFVQLTHFESGENVAHVDWLPQAASNVSFYRSVQFTAYEFDISEVEFSRWSQWINEPITKPFRLKRYNYRTLESPEPGPNSTAAEVERWKEENESRLATISSGLSAEHGQVSVAYDRSQGRAYYSKSRN